MLAQPLYVPLHNETAEEHKIKRKILNSKIQIPEKSPQALASSRRFSVFSSVSIDGRRYCFSSSRRSSKSTKCRLECGCGGAGIKQQWMRFKFGQTKQFVMNSARCFASSVQLHFIDSYLMQFTLYIFRIVFVRLGRCCAFCASFCFKLIKATLLSATLISVFHLRRSALQEIFSY